MLVSWSLIMDMESLRSCGRRRHHRLLTICMNWSLMKVGDLVRYRHYHNKLKDVRGVVCAIRNVRSGNRALVIWNHPRVQDDPNVMDWVDDLEVVSENR